jgi:NAD kinase
MQRLTENKIIVVTRETRLTGLKRRFNTARQAQFYVEHLGGNFEDYVDEDAAYLAAIQETEAALRPLGLVQFLDRAFLPNFIFGPNDTVVVLGQDGLVANTLKYTNGQPVLGVNPDPRRFDGVLLPFRTGDLETAVRETFAGRRPTRAVTMAKASLNDGRAFYAVNDFFIGPRSHVSARYIIAQGPRREPQSSSGIIVSTGLGSTGWLKSLLAGAEAIHAAQRGTSPAESPPPLPPPTVPWDADYLYFTVREPFPSRVSAATMVFGKVTADEPLSVSSQMAENGVIFSDGIESDFLDFNSGAETRVTIAERKGKLVL